MNPLNDQQVSAMGATGIADLVRQASESTSKQGRNRLTGFSLVTASMVERFIAPFLGLYLGWAVGRMPEVFPALAIPHLPMVLLLVFMVLLVSAVPPAGWKEIWSSSLPLRCVIGLFALALVTAPIGIWIAGSLEFIKERYIIAVVIFLACLVFMRDRRSLRSGAAMYVLCIAAIALFTLRTYDPNAPVFDGAGNLIDPELVSMYQRRINVGISLDPNDWGAVLVTTIPLALWLSFGSFIKRIFWGSISVILIAAIVLTASRGALLGLVAVGGTLLLVGATGWRRGILIAFAVVTVVIFGALATQGQLDRFFDFGGDDYNLTNDGRLYFWRQGIVWMIKRPWGYGIDNYPVYFGWLNGPDRAAHSSWVQYGMELGVTGLALFVLMTTALVRRNLAARRIAVQIQSRIGKLATSEAVLHGHIVAMLAGTLVTGSFLSNAYYPLMYMALGIAGAVLLGRPFRELEAAPPTPLTSTPKSPARPVTKPYRPRTPSEQ